MEPKDNLEKKEKNKTERITELQDPKRLADANFKIIIVGDCSVGKSNILSRFVSNEFDADSKSTVGVELSIKKYLIEDKAIFVNIWDTAGQERFSSITNAYYKGAKGAFIVYDITNKASFDNIDKWYRDLIKTALPEVIIYLIGNKSDLKDKRAVSIEEATAKAKTLNLSIIETSALDATNIEKVFKNEIMGIYLNTFANVPTEKGEKNLGQAMINNLAQNLQLNEPQKEQMRKCFC